MQSILYLFYPQLLPADNVEDVAGNRCIFADMRDFSSEIFYRTARSGGRGGQHVNKTETMAEAWWLIAASSFFNEEEKLRIRARLRNRISREGCLLVRSSESRSQLENKNNAKSRMLELVNDAVIIPKKRKATKPAKAVIEKRLEHKRRASEKKQRRRKDF